MPPVHYIKDGSLSFADKTILTEIETYLYPGDKICLIGRNGCGKSSLMKIIYGDYELDSGEVYIDPGIKTGYLSQDVKTDLDLTVYDFLLKQFKDPLAHKYLADIMLEKLQLNGEANLKECSGGQIRRAYLAKVLIMQPDILLLDEPTNHLDITTIEWLEEFVKAYNGAIICISHDRTFLSNVTNKIWWLDRGGLRKSDKGFKFFDEWQEEVIKEEEAILTRLNRKLETENQWLAGGVTARRKRNQKRLADLYNLRETLKQHDNKLKSAKQRMEAELIEEIKKSKFIIEAENLSFSYLNKPVINNFTFRVKKGEKIGLIGPNGSGKSTFIKLLTKIILPATGKIRHGMNLDISYFDQHRTTLNPAQTLQQTLCPTGGDQVFLPGDRTMHVAAYLKKFMFDPKLLNAKVAILSGGEASRLLLAKTLINPGNLLILDEPTNDLDMDSLEILLEILADYSGTLLVVSHDRDFLNRLVTRLLVFNNGEIIDLIGGYDDYLKYLSSHSPDKKSAKSPSQPLPIKLSIVQTEKPESKKLSYKYQRLLKTLPIEIENLEARIKAVELQLNDCNLYLSNADKFSHLTQQLASDKHKLENLIEEWINITN